MYTTNKKHCRYHDRPHKKGGLVKNEGKIKYLIIMTRHLTFRKENDGVYGAGQSAIKTQADPCPIILYRMDLGTPFHKLFHKYHIKTGYGGSMYMYNCVDVWQGGGGGGGRGLGGREEGCTG